MIYLLFFLSGIGGLIYEVVWVRQFGNVFGNTVYSASIVTAVYMLGLGVGGYALGEWADRRYAEKPNSLLRVYGYFELAIAAMGLTISLLLPYLSAVSAMASSYSVDARGWHVPSLLSYVSRGLIALVLLTPVTLLMGGTLTLLIRHLVRKDFGLETKRIAVLYGANTAGAALGAFLTDFTLVPNAGYRGSQLIAVTLNVLTALGAFALSARQASRGLAAAEPSPATATPVVAATVAASAPARGAAAARSKRGRSAVVAMPAHAPEPVPLQPASSNVVALTSLALALSGFAAMGMEILWFRHFTLLLGGFRAVFSLLLTVILVGTGAGSLVGSVLIRRTNRPAQWLMATLALFVVSTLLGLAVADLQIIDAALLLAQAADASGSLGGTLTELWLNIRAILVEVGAPALLLGFAYPLANATIQRAEHAVGRHAGVLYLANTVGAACGVIAVGFLLLPGIGMQGTASVLMVAGAVAIVPLYFASAPSAPAVRTPIVGTIALAGVTLVACASIGLWLLLPSNFMIERTTRQSNPNEKLLALSEGVNEVVAVTEIPGQGRQLLTDGHPMSFTSRMGQRYMHALADIPLLLVDKPESILVIGFGVGNTAYSTTLHPTIKRVEIADLSAQVLSHASYFTATNHDVLTNPRVSVYVNDGRQHLRMQPPATYDVIALEPPPLALAGIGALYSQEFYALARTRLKPKGYLSQWLPVYQVPMATLQVMVRAFLEVFPNAVLLGGTDEELLLVGANDARFEVDPDRLAASLAGSPAVQADLQQLGLGSVKEIVGTFVASAKTLALASQGAAPESDDRPMQEYSAASRLGWVHQDGVPAPLVDLSQAASWCPRCFSEGKPIALVQGLDAYLKLVEPLYKRMLPPTEGAGSVADPETRRMIQESPYLRELLAFHASRLNGRGGVLASSNDFDGAIAQFRNGLLLNPDSAELYWNLGRALVARGGPMGEATNDLRRAVALDPNQGPAHYDLAATLLDLHDVDGAIEHFREAVRLMPKSPEAHNNLGIALGTKGQLEDAIVQFQQATALDPANTEAQHNLTSALQAVGNGKP